MRHFSDMNMRDYPAWAAVSASTLLAFDLPAGLLVVIILTNGDDAGEVATRDCTRRWVSQRRHVRIARPPRGLDFNDLLLGLASKIVGGAK